MSNIKSGSEDKQKDFFLKSIKDLLCCKHAPDQLSDDAKLHRQRLIILIACHVVALVQSCGYFIQNTAYPYLTKSLHVSPQVYGYLISTHAVFQLIGGPFCGRLADVYGARLALLISFFSMALSYLLIAISTTIPLLFLSKLPTFFAHALQSSYVVISDITNKKDRADQLGKLGVSHGLGMILGSVTGGFVTDILGQKSAFLVAAFSQIACGLICLAFIPKNTSIIRNALEKTLLNNETDKEVDDGPEEGKQKSTSATIKEFIAVAKMPHMIYLMTLKIVTGLPFGVIGAMFTLLLMDYYKLNPKENGAVLAYLGVVGMITQGVLVGLLTKHCADEISLKISVILMCVGFLFLIISDNIYLFCVSSVPLTVGGSLLHIVITSIITKVVRNDQTGSALGLTSCTHALYKTISPTIGGFLFERVGFFSFGVLGYATNLVLIVYLCFFGRRKFE